MTSTLHLTVARDYAFGAPSGNYEYLLWDGDVIVKRQGMFSSYAKAKREALKVANSLLKAAP
jgi:hypothetical protein